MRTAIVGASGRTMSFLTQLLLARGEEVVGTVRNSPRSKALPKGGAEYVELNLEAEPSVMDWRFLAHADAVIFAAGAGYGSSHDRKLSVDLQGAIRACQAAVTHGVSRFVMVSSMGADRALVGEDSFSDYLRLKAEADDYLMSSSLEWTVVRPSGLRDGSGTGAIQTGTDMRGGSIARVDLSKVIDRVLHDPSSIGSVFEVTEGVVPIAHAQLHFGRE
ncbi:hypothetical protein BS297_27365 [Rhodococcus erythropolis]|uniref:NAD(P)-binding domain-containing protein n=1 Tax=Rhodococcus erythropolis TaxID=1833 RepID=A0A0C3ADW4_RHOER|nr:hypothetical protein BS297_27365 [Rhodococcus erythropolis]KIM17506.1 hypothetical protein QV65_04525 [Rhodococcus erythropolis]